MILSLKELKKMGVTSKKFFFECSPSADLINIPKTEILFPIKVCGEITLIGDHSASVSGEVDFKLKGECTRCVELTEREFTFDFDEVCGESEDGYPVVNDTIDLRKIVDDTIIMSIPINFLCKEDCKGICLKCGENLNNAQCKCK